MVPQSSPEPDRELGDPAELFVLFLDYYRKAITTKVDGLDEEQLRSAVLPSGWTPLGLVKHLAFMERRWIVWGFLGRDVDEPWGDSDPDGPGWRVRDDETLADLLAAMRDGAVTTAEVARSHALTDSAAETGRFAGESRVPTLAWTLFHVLQEYARHAGHLDVVRELIDGATGE